MADISLKLDETNELIFKVDITGTEPVDASPMIRFVCEDKNVSYIFEGKYNDDQEVEVVVPPMKGRLKEGTEYKTKLEVILEDRYFVPLELDAVFEQATKVVAEMVTRKKAEPKPEKKSVQAALVSKPKTKKTVVETKKKVSRAGSLRDRYKKGKL